MNSRAIPPSLWWRPPVLPSSTGRQYESRPVRRAGAGRRQGEPGGSGRQLCGGLGGLPVCRAGASPRRTETAHTGNYGKGDSGGKTNPVLSALSADSLNREETQCRLRKILSGARLPVPIRLRAPRRRMAGAPVSGISIVRRPATPLGTIPAIRPATTTTTSVRTQP